MLTSRESLVRLVGKRRRFLPNRHSLLSTPPQDPCSGDDEDVSPVDRMEDLKARENDNSFSGSSPVAEWVSCPVCGSKVRGEDYMINSHLGVASRIIAEEVYSFHPYTSYIISLSSGLLFTIISYLFVDVCLVKGKKRKLTQRTLLQLDFGRKSSSSFESSESGKLGSNVVSLGSLNSTLSKKAVVGLQNSNTGVEKDIDGGESVSVVDTSVVDFQAVEEIYDCDDRSHLVDSSSVTSTTGIDSRAEAVTRDYTSGMALDTYIVGRKFSVEKDLNHGASIYLS